LRILYLIGNGFDINLNLETKYEHFYNYYVGLESKSPEIKKLKKDIDGSYEKWADFEISLGEYTKKISNPDIFLQILDDIVKALSVYIRSQESQLEIDISAPYLVDIMSKPWIHLDKRDESKFAANGYLSGNIARNINVITFNYTNTLESILGEKMPVNNANNALHNLNHVHGSHYGNMVLGVNDVEQISNLEFRKNELILDSFVKDDSNFAMGHENEESCRDFVNAATLICIYGSSIGYSDLLWWQLIFSRLSTSDNLRLIIFEKVNLEKIERENRKRYIKDQVKNDFIKKAMVKDPLRDDEREAVLISSVKEKIFVSLNSNIFDLN